MQQVRLFRPYKVTLFLLYICSMYPWFVWHIPEAYISLFGATISLLFYLGNRDQFEVTSRKMMLNLIAIIAIAWCNISANINGIIGQSFLLISLLILINTRDELKLEIFRFITNAMAILLGISLVFYFLFLLKVKLPYTTLQESELGYSGYNYYGFIFIKNEDIFGYYRFKSIFAEPGHLTMGLIPLLFANRFNVKKFSVVILLIAELFTLSLAGYIAMTSSIFLFSFPRARRSRPAKIMLLAIILTSVYVIGNLEKKTVINKAIIQRLQLTRSEGLIAGYNRTTVNTDMLYDKFLKSPDLLTGTDYKKNFDYLVGSTGYKVYMIRFGLIGTLLVVIFYLTYALSFRKYEILGLFLIMMTLLFQNGYPFWYAVVFGYILGIASLFHEDEEKELQPDPHNPLLPDESPVPRTQF